MSGWQPIETAPLEKAVLVWDKQVVVGIQKEYRGHPGRVWWVHDTYGFCEDSQIYKPTHWCPLPPGPEEG